jgi:hypothetical protein
MQRIHHTLYNVQSHFFNLFIILTYVSYIGIAIGIQIISPHNLHTLDYYVKIYVCLFLLYRFNPFRKIEFNELDRKMAFSAGVFLLSTTFINEFIQRYTQLALNIINL